MNRDGAERRDRRGWGARQLQSDSSNGISKAGPAEIPGRPQGCENRFRESTRIRPTPELLGPHPAAAKKWAAR